MPLFSQAWSKVPWSLWQELWLHQSWKLVNNPWILFSQYWEAKNTVSHSSLPELCSSFHNFSPSRIKYIDSSKICGCKISTVTSLLSLPWSTDNNILILPECAQLKGLHCRISLRRLCLHRCCYCAKDSSLLHHYLIFQPMIFLPFQIETR